MTIRSSFASFVGKSTYWLLRDVLHRGGTSLPGKIATNIDPDILKISLKTSMSSWLLVQMVKL